MGSSTVMRFSLWRSAAASLVFAALFPTSSVADTILLRADFVELMGVRQSSFMARDLVSGQTCVLEGSDLETRHAPWSTFKIPNTLIALQSGVAAGIEDWRDWDPAKRPALAYWPETWRQGQTLKTAFQRSALWYYQDLALEIGAAHYRSVLSAWDYGNADAPDGSDTFWLGGPLKLSVTEQVAFLQRMVTGRLGVEDVHLADLTAAAYAGPLGSMALHGKTGAGPTRGAASPGAFEGWYAGWLVQDDAVTVVFAHHATGPYFQAIRTYRRDFAETLLAACGWIDAQG